MPDLLTLSAKKAELDRLGPLPLALQANLTAWFRVELTYTSNAIEGNTLNRQETALVVEKGLTVGGKTLTEHLEAVGHAQAFDWLQLRVAQSYRDLTERTILELHRLVLRGTDPDHAGCYRTVAVRIAGAEVVLPNPAKVSALVHTLVTRLQASDDRHPVLRAVDAHYELVSIHPFIDGNGRTARLLMNLLLLQAGYPPAVIRPAERLRYVKALERAQLGGSRDDFDQVVIEAVDRSLDLYLNAINQV